MRKPPTLAVDKKSGKARFYDGNHRMALFKILNIKWIPIVINYNYYIYGGKDLGFATVPKLFPVGKWPQNPTPKSLGFDSIPLPS